jgi:hypothetical protein
VSTQELTTEPGRPSSVWDNLTPAQVRVRIAKVGINRHRLERIEEERKGAGVDLEALNEETWRLHAETFALLSLLGEHFGDPTATVELGPLLRLATLRAADAGRTRARSESSTTTKRPWLTVAEWAARRGISRGTADKLLARGFVHGAERKTPGQKGSPWLIPADANVGTRDG